MATFDISATSVRIPSEAKHALASKKVVEVLNHGNPSIVMLHPDVYAVIRPILERQQLGLPVPINSLLDDDDLAFLADLREEDGGQQLTTSASWA